MTTHNTLTEEQRSATKDLIDNRIWVALGKYSGALLVALGFIFYTYNQSEGYTDNRLNVVVSNTNELLRANGELKIILVKNQTDIAYLKKAIEEEKKNRECADSDIIHRLSKLEVSK